MNSIPKIIFELNELILGNSLPKAIYLDDEKYKEFDDYMREWSIKRYGIDTLFDHAEFGVTRRFKNIPVLLKEQKL